MKNSKVENVATTPATTDADNDNVEVNQVALFLATQTENFTGSLTDEPTAIYIKSGLVAENPINRRTSCQNELDARAGQFAAISSHYGTMPVLTLLELDGKTISYNALQLLALVKKDGADYPALKSDVIRKGGIDNSYESKQQDSAKIDTSYSWAWITDYNFKMPLKMDKKAGLFAEYTGQDLKADRKKVLMHLIENDAPFTCGDYVDAETNTFFLQFKAEKTV